MTRKDYIAIAAALQSVRPAAYREDLASVGKRDYGHGRADGWEAAIHALANVCASDNPRFDRQRFLKAAGVQS